MEYIQVYCFARWSLLRPQKIHIKLLKAPLAVLHRAGHIVVAYIDDILNISETSDSCKQAIIYSMNISDSLGFIIHPKNLSSYLLER